MPSQLHETIVALFKAQIRLAPDLLREGLGLALPQYESVSEVSTDFSETRPAEYRADHAVLLQGEGSSLGIVIEVQLTRDERKRYSWPYYATSLRARHRCPTLVLIVCPKRAVAKWARAPIDLGGGNQFRPTVIGPEQVPEVRSVAKACEDPELAVLSALAHGSSKDLGTAVEIASAAIAAVAALDREDSTYYYDIIWSGLGPEVKEALRVAKANYEYQSDFARKYVAQGRQEGREEGREEGQLTGARQTLGRLLRLKFGGLPDWVEPRLSQAGAQELEDWTCRILTASTLEEIFED